jgi:glycosyltransferase involved in cell wall biosynthesis
VLTILHVITDLDRGGAETVLYRLMLNINADSHQHHVVVSLRDCGFFGDKLEAVGVPVHSLGMGGARNLPGALFKLVKLMRSLRPDVVQTWLYHADLLGGFAAQFAGRPPVIWGVHTVHLDASSSLLTKLIRRFCAWTSAWLPSTILCVARAAVESHAALGYVRDKMQVVPNGFDLPNIEALRAEAHALRSSLGFESHHQVIGCVGRFHPDKDYPTFLRAASLLKECHPDVRFLLVGKSLSPSNVVLMSWIVEAGLQGYVVTLGERNDISTCLIAMDVFCLPSKTEAFPLALGEAMAAGRPVVTTDVGDAALLVGEAGIIVPAGDPKRLCNGLQRMLQCSTRDLQELGAAARQRIECGFSMQSMVSRIQDIYRIVSVH